MVSLLLTRTGDGVALFKRRSASPALQLMAAARLLAGGGGIPMRDIATRVPSTTRTAQRGVAMSRRDVERDRHVAALLAARAFIEIRYLAWNAQQTPEDQPSTAGAGTANDGESPTAQ